MINYVFDVDGTLTPSCGKMDPGFKDVFLEWMVNKNVYLLTGSDSEKTIAQVGRDLWSHTIAYQCSGNEIYAFGHKVYELDWPKDNDPLFEVLRYCLENHVYPYQRYWNNVEVRKGLVNFSELGRDCPQEAREKYFEWDNKNHSRQELCEYITEECPDLEVSIGGQISIDIYPKGRNKGQVLDYIGDEGPIYFFGDRTQPGGNDYALASLLKEPHKVFQVSGPEETLSILKGLQ